MIPLPKHIDLNKDTPFALTKNTIIYYDEGDSLRREAEFLAEYLSDLMDRDFQIKPIEASTRTGVFLVVDDEHCGAAEGHSDGYEIDITPERIVVTGTDAAGVFYGIQTLRKSMPVGEKVDVVHFPAGTIQDFPQFAYRGMHLDVSRHFIPLDSVKRYLDMMAMHNIN